MQYNLLKSNSKGNDHKKTAAEERTQEAKILEEKIDGMFIF